MDPGYQGENAKIYCLLRGEADVSDLHLPSSEWEYGVPIPGYRLQGLCAPLDRHRKYSVGASGPGIGEAVFSIESNGSIHMYEDDCQRTKPNTPLTR
jgi:hypothetical protein